MNQEHLEIGTAVWFTYQEPNGGKLGTIADEVASRTEHVNGDLIYRLGGQILSELKFYQNNPENLYWKYRRYGKWVESKVLKIFTDADDCIFAIRNIDIAPGINFNEQMKKIQLSLINTALLLTNGHQTRAARLLGLNPTTLNAKMKKLK